MVSDVAGAPTRAHVALGVTRGAVSGRPIQRKPWRADPTVQEGDHGERAAGYIRATHLCPPLEQKWTSAVCRRSKLGGSGPVGSFIRRGSTRAPSRAVDRCGVSDAPEPAPRATGLSWACRCRRSARCRPRILPAGPSGRMLIVVDDGDHTMTCRHRAGEPGGIRASGR